MTCRGFVVRDGAGYLWGDSEQYLAGRQMTHQIEKVAASPGGIAAVATGHSSLCAKVRRLTTGLGLAPFSAAIARLPPAAEGLRRGARALSRAWGPLRSQLRARPDRLVRRRNARRSIRGRRRVRAERRVRMAFTGCRRRATDDGAGGPRHCAASTAAGQEPPLSGRDRKGAHHRPCRRGQDRHAVCQAADRRRAGGVNFAGVCKDKPATVWPRGMGARRG
jgi:hypothetical protein